MWLSDPDLLVSDSVSHILWGYLITTEPSTPRGLQDSRLKIFVVCAAEAFLGLGAFILEHLDHRYIPLKPHWNYVLRETANNCAECEVDIRIYDAFMDTHAQVSSCR